MAFVLIGDGSIFEEKVSPIVTTELIIIFLSVNGDWSSLEWVNINRWLVYTPGLFKGRFDLPRNRLLTIAYLEFPSHFRTDYDNDTCDKHNHPFDLGTSNFLRSLAIGDFEYTGEGTIAHGSFT